ncbi:hypothetical protein E2C01_014011 [Portunus trituberculatus]|uniref:Uncharacterized protein n=1 Tax=Portunus trituberculatus TaxID=210409 RepID=A0A5B7DI18_PORTR|nr:hypothetical protein [Portunus trituberculatus]
MCIQTWEAQGRRWRESAPLRDPYDSSRAGRRDGKLGGWYGGRDIEREGGREGQSARRAILGGREAADRRLKRTPAA